MNIRYAFAIRHGKDIGDKLTERGIEDTRIIARKIKTFLQGDEEVHLFHSYYQRSQETAGVIQSELNVESVRRLLILNEDSHHQGARASEEIEKLVAQSEIPVVVIAVTHFEAPSGVIHGFAQRHFNQGVMCTESRNSCGFRINMETGKTDPLSFLH